MYLDSTFDVSPDGDWIVYGDLYTVFLGNLVNGQVKAIQDAQQSSFSGVPTVGILLLGPVYGVSVQLIPPLLL